MIDISHLANRCEAVFVNAADFSGGHFDQRITAFEVAQRCLLSGAARNLTAAARRQLDIVNVCAERNRAKRQRVPQIGRDIVAGRNCRSNAESVGRENVTQLAIRVFNESDARRTVRIVLDPHHLSDDSALAPYEIDLAIFLFVTTADVPRCEPAKIVTAAAFFLWLNEALRWAPLRDFIEARQRFEPQRRR